LEAAAEFLGFGGLLALVEEGFPEILEAEVFSVEA
jgi:hypothetical protein